jgi:ring-1,2-phenylacetyl-CoA epoxidase subunit PaaE
MLSFTELAVSDIRRETADSVSVGLFVPTAQRQAFAFAPGQFLTLRKTINHQDVRRAYSLCVPPKQFEVTGKLRVAVKEVPGGVFSTYMNRTLQVGERIEVLPPDGRFTTLINAAHALHYVGFAGGSGITPILSLAATLLDGEPNSRFTLIYGNRTAASIMFVEALQDLKDRYLNRFVLHHILSDEPQEIALHHGLLNREKCSALLASVIPAAGIDRAFVCGPDPMMDAVEQSLLASGVPKDRILIERFGVPMPAGATRNTVPADGQAVRTKLSIVADGKTRVITLAPDQTVLEAGLAAGLALPFACKAGVCCTCKAKVLSGTVRMRRNYTLSDVEQQQRFVLTCQAVCTSDDVQVSFDER